VRRRARHVSFNGSAGEPRILRDAPGRRSCAMTTPRAPAPDRELVALEVDGVTLPGELAVPPDARGAVLFVQAGGRALANDRERALAHGLERDGFATLRIELLDDEERLADEVQRHLRYDVDAIAHRVSAAIDWLGEQGATSDLSVGCMGIGVGAAAALVAAADRPSAVDAVVARGGRPDLAGEALARVRAPALFVVAGEDTILEELSLLAMHRIRGEAGLAVVPGADHQFDDPIAFEEVRALTTDWFAQHLVRWMRRSGERVIATGSRRPSSSVQRRRGAPRSGPPSSRGM
jgi:dienelactone hydrolase